MTASSVRSDPDTWLVGATPGAASAKIADRYGARHSGLGNYVVERSRAKALAGDLEKAGLLLYAQANTILKTKQTVPDDPLSSPPNAWRAKVAPQTFMPPAVAPTSPLIALVDAAADATHPEWAGGNFSTIPGVPVTSSHGTATAAVAAAPLNGVGILGVWPSARALNVPLPVAPGTEGGITCASSGEAIGKAIQAGAAVIIMSYGSPSRCAAEWVQLYFGIAKGIIPVAAAGNEFQEGNPLKFPASLPHVVTVAATTPDDRSAIFSNANTAVDLSAPGVGILTAVPPALDTDGVQDGYQAMDGTSFSAPMVSAAMAWVRAARPELTPDRVVEAIKRSATDVVAPDGVNRPGWDPLTGFGVLNVGAALQIPVESCRSTTRSSPTTTSCGWTGPRSASPRRRSGRAASRSRSTRCWTRPRTRWTSTGSSSRRRRRSRSASSRASATRRWRSSPPRRSRSTTSTGAWRARALSGSKKTERVSVRNRGSKKRSYFIAIKPQGSSRYQERQYSLRVR